MPKIGTLIELAYGKPLAPTDRDPTGPYPVYGANGEKDRSKRYLCSEPTIVVGRKGSAGALNLTSEHFWPLDVTYFVKYDKSKHDLLYLYYSLLTCNLPSLARGIKPGLNRNDVYSLEIYAPYLDEQIAIRTRLTRLLDDLAALRANAERTISSLDELESSLLISALSGK